MLKKSMVGNADKKKETTSERSLVNSYEDYDVVIMGTWCKMPSAEDRGIEVDICSNPDFRVTRL